MRSSYTAICNLCSLLIFYLLRQITQVMMFGSGDIFMPVFKHHSNSSAIKVQLLKPVVGYQNRLIDADKEMSCLILSAIKPSQYALLHVSPLFCLALRRYPMSFRLCGFSFCDISEQHLLFVFQLFQNKAPGFHIQQNNNLERCCLLTCSKRTCKGMRLTERDLGWISLQVRE